MWQADLATIGIKLIPEEVDAATLSSLQTSAPGQPMVEARWYAGLPRPGQLQERGVDQVLARPPHHGLRRGLRG